MKPYLLFPDRDLDAEAGRQAAADALVQDLALDTLFEAMAGGDRHLREVANATVLASLTDADEIRYRQDVLADCLAAPDVPRSLYDLAGEALESERKVWVGLVGRSPEYLLQRSVAVLEALVVSLERLREIVTRAGGAFESAGFRRFAAMVEAELDDAYLREVRGHLENLRLKDGLLLSAALGRANRGTAYVLRRPAPGRRSWRDRLGIPEAGSLTYTIPDRDENGYKALSELRDEGLVLAAVALTRSADHVLAFFRVLRAEIGFYLACVNLHARLEELGQATCRPEVVPAEAGWTVRAAGLGDPCLALSMGEPVVGSDAAGEGAGLIVITGANRGGKTAYLRALGVAQLMAQCGLFVAAEAFRVDARDGIFTHFKREEDAALRSGKLDEELGRMREIVDRITPASLVLLNESFASTNEREGSEIAGQVVRALVAAGVRVAFVTHQYTLAHDLHARPPCPALFLRAERSPEGVPTFRLVEGAPLPTSHGGDVYERVFGSLPDEPDG